MIPVVVACRTEVDRVPAFLDSVLQEFLAGMDCNLIILGYSASFNALAQEALRRGWRAGDLTAAVTNAERLFECQRRAMREAFRRPVPETYGMAESVAAEGECEHGRLHLWPEVGAAQVAERAGLHKFVCTGLLKADMPLVRYRVGDRAGEPEPGCQCPCERGLPVLGPVEGRTNDVLMGRDGRLIFWLNSILYGLPVREAQVVQEDVRRVRVRYVPADDSGVEPGRVIAARLRKRLGPVEVILEPVDHIPRGPNGKFRAVIGLLDKTAVSDN